MNINVFLLFFSFVFLRIESEREGIQNLGIRRNGPKVTYLIFRRGSTGESFFFYGLIDFRLFLTLAWGKWLLRVSQIFFRLLHSEYLAFGSVSYEPCPTTDFSYYLFPLTGRSPHFRFGVPANHLASLFFLLVSGDLSEVTKYQHLLVSPLWPTFFLNSPSLTAC